MTEIEEQMDRISEGVKKYMRDNSETLPVFVLLSEDSFNHVANIGTNIMMAKWDILPYPPGDFVKCIINNDLMGTFGRADSINKKCIEFYVTLIYNLGYID